MNTQVQQALAYHARAETPDETTLFGVHGIRVTLGDLKHALAEARQSARDEGAVVTTRTGPRLSAAPDKAPAGQRTPR